MPLFNTGIGSATNIVVDTSGYIQNRPYMPVSVAYGQKTVVTAGTRIAVHTSLLIYSGVSIKANSNNTGVLYIGGPSVTASNGYVLRPGESIFIVINNPIAISVDSSVSGDGFSYICS